MSRTVYYDSDGNEIYNDMPTYAQEQLADIERRETVDRYEGEHKVKQTGLSFGQAIEAMKAGKRCSRVGWNGKNQYIELATNISYKDAHGDVINANHDDIGNHAIAFVGTSGVQLGWLASQSDMLAEDWQIVG